MHKGAPKERADRAKQFMPFAALRGFEELVEEIARARESKRELLDDHMAELDAALQRLAPDDVVTVRHYKNEAYLETTGNLLEIREIERELVVDGTAISIDDVFDIKHVGQK